MNINININNTQYLYTDKVRDEENIRLSFDRLSQKTFGLSFEQFYQSGSWQDKYIPHVLIHNGEVVCNVSVNIMEFDICGQRKKYIQLGTVMTDDRYRNQGLSRALMEIVMGKYKDECDAIYLFANDSVLDFYPKFNFIKAQEYQRSLRIENVKTNCRKLNMDNADNIKVLSDMYAKGNSFSRFDMRENVGLVMFYCLQFMKESVYYCDELGVVVIADFDGDTMVCYDIYGGKQQNIFDIIGAVAYEGVRKVCFGFSLKHTENMQESLHKEEDTTLFVLAGKDDVFKDNKLMFPILSHA